MDAWDRFQIAALAAFLLIFGGKLAYALATGSRPLAIGVGKRGAARFVELALPLAFVVWVWAILSHTALPRTAILPWPAYQILFSLAPLRFAGAGLLVAALLMLTGALVSFGRSWRVGVADPGALVTHGAFGFSRNPIFLALNLICVGTFLINGTLIMLLLMLGEIAGVHYQILQEERYLRGRFGDAYEQYCSQTRRYWGWRRGSKPG